MTDIGFKTSEPDHWLWLLVVAALAVSASACAGQSSEAGSANRPSATSTPSGTGVARLRYVAFGDSWPECAHCNGCTTFAGLWADNIEKQTGKRIEFTDLTGANEGSSAESKTSASLLESLKTNERTRAAVQDADIILIATGPNEMEMTDQPLRDGSCGPEDDYSCIRALGRTWASNFEAILVEIDNLRQGKPTTIRLVNAANPWLSDPEMSEGLPDNFAATGGALIFQLLTDAMCDPAATHHAKCVDVRPLLNGPKLNRAVDENSPESMQKIADALGATGLPELDLRAQ